MAQVNRVFIAIVTTAFLIPAVALAFSGWTPVPGNGHTDVALATTQRDFDGKYWTFAKGIEGRIWYLRDGDRVWTEVPGNGITDAAPCVAIQEKWPWPRILLLFVKGVEGGIWVNSKRDGYEAWSGWSAVPGMQTNHAPGCVAGGTRGPRFTIVQRNWVFVRGTNGRVYATYNLNDQSDGRPTNWKSWFAVGSLTTSTTPTGVWLGTGLAVFAPRSSDNQISWIRENNTSFGSWSIIGGVTNSSIGAFVSSSGLQIFVKGIEDQRIHMNTHGVSSWSGWSEVTGGGHTDAGIAAGQGNGRVRLVVKGIEDKGIYENQ